MPSHPSPCAPVYPAELPSHVLGSCSIPVSTCHASTRPPPSQPRWPTCDAQPHARQLHLVALAHKSRGGRALWRGKHAGCQCAHGGGGDQEAGRYKQPGMSAACPPHSRRASRFPHHMSETKSDSLQNHANQNWTAAIQPCQLPQASHLTRLSCGPPLIGLVHTLSKLASAWR